MTEDCCRRGRGRISFGAALLPNGQVDTNANGWGSLWGQNWGGVSNGGYQGGQLVMPMGLFVGNAERMTITPEVEELGQEVDWTGSGGAGDCNDYHVTGATIELTLLCHSARNLIQLLYGEQQAQVSGLQSYAVDLGGNIPAGTTVFLPQRVDDGVVMTVNTSWGAALVPGTHYTARPFGPLFDNGLNVPSNAVAPKLTIAYTALPTVQIETLQTRGMDVSIVYDGINLHGSTPLRDDIYRVRLQPIKSYDFINKDSHKLELSGSVLGVTVGGKTRRWRTWPGM
jgi:hypothetical protein